MRRKAIPALVALTLAACGSSQTTSSSNSTTSTASSAQSGTSNRAGTGAAATSGCDAAQLRLAYVGTEGATGHLEVTFALRNVSSTPCRLRGYPAARLLSKNGVALPLKAQRGGGFFPDSQRAPQPVIVKPGGRAHFGVSFVTNSEYARARTCRTAVAAMSSAPASPGHWWHLSLHGAPRIAPCGDQLVVSPIHA
jgi:hypothetical protein